MKVTVSESFQVFHDGTVYRPGEVADVPDEVAAEWLQSGWVTEVPAATRKGPASKVTR